MSFINSLSTNKGETGDRGERGERGETGARGIIGITGNTGAKGDQGAAGTDGNNAGPNPSFESVDVETLNFENSLKNDGNKILQSTSIQLNSTWRDIPDIGNRFTGIVTLTPQNDNLSCGTFAVSNSSSSQGGSVTELSVQSDDSDSTKRVKLGYVSGELKATKDNEGGYQIYNVSYFGFH